MDTGLLPPPFNNDQHALFNISPEMATGTVVPERRTISAPRHVSDGPSSRLLSHLIMTISLIVSCFSPPSPLVFCKVTFSAAAQDCYQHPAAAHTAIVLAFASSDGSRGSLLTAGTLLIAGPVCCEGQRHCPPPYLFFSFFFNLALAARARRFPNGVGAFH